MSLLTVGLTPHRLEFLPAILGSLKKHDWILLEEPPDPEFANMLRGEITVTAYVEQSEAGFPEYAKALAEELKKLYREGKRICQVEPYLERWVLIRALLDHGVPAEEVRKCPELTAVYDMEHLCFGRLLDYYAAMQGPFDLLVEKIKAFAQADAQRITLRDAMRAREIISLVKKTRAPSFYVEAGYIHLKLLYFLAREGKGLIRLRTENLLLKALSARGFHKVLPSPGDGLTSYYLFGGKHRNLSEDLLAARSIVYIKLIEKNELRPNPEDPFPHLRNELLWRLFVWQLSYEECKALDRLIRLLPTTKAREVARRVFAPAYQKALQRLEAFNFGAWEAR